MLALRVELLWESSDASCHATLPALVQEQTAAVVSDLVAVVTSKPAFVSTEQSVIVILIITIIVRNNGGSFDINQTVVFNRAAKIAVAVPERENVHLRLSPLNALDTRRQLIHFLRLILTLTPLRLLLWAQRQSRQATTEAMAV